MLRQRMEIELTQGKNTMIDDADWPLVSKFKWNAKNESGRWYATTTRKRRVLRLHRVVMDAPKNMMVDHIDGNTLNNRLSNLRLCTNAENQQNSSARRGTSKHK